MLLVSIALAEPAVPPPEPVATEPVTESAPANQLPNGFSAGRTIRLVRQVDPTFPREAKMNREVHATCEVTVRITPEGVPDDLHPDACEELFVAPTLAAIREWRFDADPLEGAPAPAVFRVTVAYDWPKK